MNQAEEKTIVTALTGASGMIYALRLIKALVEADVNILVIVSPAAQTVLAHEMDLDANVFQEELFSRYAISSEKRNRIQVFSSTDIGGPCASGSFVHQGMAVVPCSMKSLSAVASGFADNLITRSCDVCLKEKRPLILVPRETPFHTIHLENMARVARAGAVVLPPNPSFYTRPATIEELADTVVARILDHLGIDHCVSGRWPV